MNVFKFIENLKPFFNWLDFCKQIFMITPLKKIYLTLFVVALVMELPIFYFLKDRIHPLQIKPAPHSYFRTGTFDCFFKDLNHDGLGEYFEIENDVQEKNYNIKIYYFVNRKPVLLNQFNFISKLRHKELAFYDLNKDGWDELFVFTNDENYLYLTVIDLQSKRPYMLSRQKLVAAPVPNPHSYWDVERLNPAFLDINDDHFPELIFTVHSGLSLSPRGIYAFDLKQRKIIRAFSYHAGPATLALQDVDLDGHSEILLATYATANWPDTAAYSDRTCWLFALDRRLRPITPPKRFGEPFSSIIILPLNTTNGAKQFIYLNSRSKGPQLLGLDQFRLQSVAALPDEADYFIGREDAENGYLVYIFYRTLNRVDAYNADLQRVRSYALKEEENITYVRFFHPFGTKEALFFVSALNSLRIYDINFKLLARLPLKNQFVSRISFLGRNALGRPEFGLTTNEYFQRFKVAENPFYVSWPVLAFLSLVLLFALLFMSHLGINQLRLYITYLFFSLRQSDNAIILLNGSGKIVSYNAKVEEWLNLDGSLKKCHYKTLLKGRRQILEAVDEAITGARPIKRNLRFEGDKVRFYGEISVTPFFIYFKYAHAYVVELRDSTGQILMERHKNWQQSIRSLVHDLKNPLAGLQLKIQTLYLKLQKKYPQAAQELNHELETAYSEIKRIRRISQDFLKFTRLEQIRFKKIVLKNFLVKVINQFDAFQSANLKITLTIENNTPKIVYWDARQVELLINIFIKNAIDAIGGKGKITVTVDRNGSKNQQKQILISIEDNGPGIPDQIKERIFDPFFTTKKEGSGMGLAFANQIVFQHKGRIKLVNGHKKGARFLIILPLNPESIKSGGRDV